MEERIERHIYQYVEAELRNYRTYKKLIAEYEGYDYQGAKSGLGIDPSGRFGKGKPGDSTASEAIQKLANENRVKRMMDVCRCIDDVLEQLDEQNTKLVEMRYFSSWYTDSGVIRKLHVGRSKYYDDKRRIIRMMALRMRLL